MPEIEPAEGARYFTNSEFECFRRCRRKHWLSCIRHLSPARERFSLGRETGNLVHGALAHQYGAKGDPIVWLLMNGPALMDRFLTAPQNTSSMDEYSVAADVEIQAEVDEAQLLAKIMVEGYLEWLAETGVDSDLEVVAAEDEVGVNYSLPTGDEVVLLGKLDLRVRRLSDGAQMFLDHKTVGDLTSLPKTAHLDTQLKHYHLLEYLDLKVNGGSAPVTQRTDGGIFNMLRRVKRTARANPPFYGRWEVRHNPTEMQNFWTQVHSYMGDILRVEDQLAAYEKLGKTTEHQWLAPPNPTDTCSWDCEFFQVCPMFDDGSDAEGFLAAAFKVEDPLARYTRIEKGGRS